MNNEDQEIEIEIERENEDAPPFPPVVTPMTVTNPDQEKPFQAPENQNVERWKSLVQASKIFFGIDNKTEPESNSPIYTNKTLVNWNERTLKVLKNKRIFGGKIKESAVKQFIEDIDENLLDEGDSYRYFKATNRVLPKRRQDNLTSFIGNKLGSVLQKQKPQHQNIQGQRFVPVDEDFPDFRKDEQREAEDNVDGPWDAFTSACANRRIPGMGFFGRLFDYTFDPNKDSDLYSQLINTTINHRAYFTYWVTFVQILIFVGSLVAYGFAPIGFTSTFKEKYVITINLEKQFLNYEVKDNFWIGPSAKDLVHLGAKYAPCMRNDSDIYKRIEQDRLIEKETACCIRNDKGGCVQTTQEKCSKLFSKWDKWKNGSEISMKRNRTSGSVCGQDPDFCNDPGSKNWIDDITQWPICSKPSLIINSSVEKNQHMFCEVIGRPCCIGLQGQCIITTLEHCDFMRGYFHEEASLCSQVDCMQDVCGMMDFLDPKSPDQVYRLFTSIFIHAGIIQLLISIFFQFFILRDLENLAGCLRIGIIYSGSGILGNLASVIFLPYQAEAGPAASHFGILACSFIELFQIWKLYENPWIPFSKLIIFMISLFIIGLLPMIDNFANIFGFISGLILGTIFFPNVTLNGKLKLKRVFIISLAIFGLIFYVGTLVSLFYLKPLNNCEWCKFISCPLGRTFCIEMDFNVIRVNQ